MTFRLNHVHLKTPDPQKTVQFYVDNLGATIEEERGARGYRLDLHGLKLNVTPLADNQTREQHYGMEHFALDTDDFDALVTQLKASGARFMEQLTGGSGRRVCFFEGPDGVQLEFIEME